MNFEFMLYNDKVRREVARMQKVAGDSGCTYFRGKKDNCPICMKSMEHSGGIQLKCNHAFHCACIELWWDRVRNCPLCRMDHSVKEECEQESDNDDPYSEQYYS